MSSHVPTAGGLGVRRRLWVPVEAALRPRNPLRPVLPCFLQKRARRLRTERPPHPPDAQAPGARCLVPAAAPRRGPNCPGDATLRGEAAARDRGADEVAGRRRKESRRGETPMPNTIKGSEGCGNAVGVGGKRFPARLGGPGRNCGGSPYTLPRRRFPATPSFFKLRPDRILRVLSDAGVFLRRHNQSVRNSCFLRCQVCGR